MGLILDSSILIAGERGGQTVSDILKRVRAAHGETESGLSALTIVELTHGIYRAKSTAIEIAAEHSRRSYAAT